MLLFFIFIFSGLLILACGEGSQIGSVAAKIHKLIFWGLVALFIIGLMIGVIALIFVGLFSIVA